MASIRGVAASAGLGGAALGAWSGAVPALPAIATAVALGVLFALWEGARPEVVAFGRDVAATILAWLRRQLNIRGAASRR
jgi:hypothetical protein